MSGRRFLNLLVENVPRGVHSLRRFDLSRNQFFYTKPEEVASRGRVLPLWDVEGQSKGRRKKRKQDLQVEKIDTFKLPAPVMSARPTPCPRMVPWRQDQLHCFPLSESNFLFADSGGRMVNYDTDLSCFTTMPSLHAPKESPFALTINLEDTNGVGSIYIIDEVLRPDKSNQFKALVSKPRSMSNPWGTWQCHSLPLPPYVSEQSYKSPMSPIYACAVVDNRVICISVAGFGTYCFDTASHAWSQAGGWLLPFCGMAEYVPEFNLWFGISAHNKHLPCAADLSAVVRGQPPEQSFVWEDVHFPEDWSPCFSAQMVSLGYGRFCITRFFQNMVTSKHDVDVLLPRKFFAVLSGLEVLAVEGKGKGKDESNGNDNGSGSAEGNSNGKIHRLRVIKHKSRRFNYSETSVIESLL